MAILRGMGGLRRGRRSAFCLRGRIFVGFRGGEGCYWVGVQPYGCAVERVESTGFVDTGSI